ncbi:MAG: ATP-binding protein [Stackebrandtia sp.]
MSRLLRRSSYIPSIRRRILQIYVTLIGALLLALEVPLVYSHVHSEYHALENDQLIQADQLSHSVAAVDAGRMSRKNLSDKIDHYAASTSSVVYIVDVDCEISVTSDSKRPMREVEKNRGEFALEGTTATGRDSGVNMLGKVLGADPLVVAYPVRDSSEVIGAVVITMPTETLRDQVGMWTATYAAFGLAALLAALLVAIPLTHWILRPITQLTAVSKALSEGRYDERVPAEQGPIEVRQLAASFNTMVDRVVDALNRQKTFVADAAHQLRNPLTALRMRIEGLYPLMPEANRRSLVPAIVETERLASILNQMLTLARADAQSLPREPQDAKTVTAERVEHWREIAHGYGITLKLTADPVEVAAGQGVLCQALDVLLDNAIRVTPEGGYVMVRVRGVGEKAHIDVIDQGPGMSDAELARARDRFWQADRGSGRRAGSGLGLAIASSLLEGSEGVLSLDNTLSAGLHARITLPQWHGYSY